MDSWGGYRASVGKSGDTELLRNRDHLPEGACSTIPGPPKWPSRWRHTCTTSLPDMVRGYEQIKVQNVHRYRKELAWLRDEFGESHRLGTLDKTASGSPDR